MGELLKGPFGSRVQVTEPWNECFKTGRFSTKFLSEAWLLFVCSCHSPHSVPRRGNFFAAPKACGSSCLPHPSLEILQKLPPLRTRTDQVNHFLFVFPSVLKLELQPFLLPHCNYLRLYMPTHPQKHPRGARPGFIFLSTVPRTLSTQEKFVISLCARFASEKQGKRSSSVDYASEEEEKGNFCGKNG